MTGEPRAFLAIDRGAATSGAALIGRVDGSWRLLGSVALPAASDEDAPVHFLLARVAAADPGLTRRLGIDPSDAGKLPAVAVRSTPPRRLAVVAASERALAPLIAAADRSGWRTVGASAETTDPLAMTSLLLDGSIEGILAGAGDPPGADERGAIAELTALVAAAARRRPERLVVLAGAMAENASAFGDLNAREGETLLAPAARLGPEGAPLRDLLTELALPADDARRALGPAITTLASVLDRRVELVEIGFDGGLRAVASPGSPSEGPHADVAIVPSAWLAPADPDDTAVDRVLAWTTVPSDRHRLRDRLRELRIAPWSDLTGDGAALRMAAARAALSRLADATPEFTALPAPDLVVAAGGVWSIAPAPAVALALADVLRRSGASSHALDHARLLGPLGSIADAEERRAVIADLADDLLAPLGSVVTPSGLRTGRSVGSLVVHRRSGPAFERAPIDLIPGGIEVVDLPPGSSATAEFRFRDAVRLGGRGRHFEVEVMGGLAGLVVDLRDVPMRLPDRADRRRRAPRLVADRGRRRVSRMIAEPILDLALVPARQLIESPVDAVFALAPGDRALVEAGASVVVGAPIAEQLRDPRLEDKSVSEPIEPRPGDRWHPMTRTVAPVTPGGPRGAPGGEYLFPWKSRWRVATGDIVDPLETPVAGIVRDVRPGTSITIRAAGRGIRGIVALGGPTRGRVTMAAGPEGGLRPGALDVGMAGAILVVDARVDAETLTRARAMGVRGIVVAGLASKERRDFLASEARQRAALHRLPPYAVLVMDGATRRPMAGPIMTLLAAMTGLEVAIVSDPPMLVFDHPGLTLPTPIPQQVRIRAGSLSGQEALWLGAAGRRRFAGGVDLEAGHVRLSDGSTVAIPLGDLERFV